ncbi:DUF4363 family protein [Ruminococcus sp. NK3A76]|uniref:DUF4363 family protein n=1 Tax=Ruminococcus sp. NK3A76 TaxID=877411 RepID=UPI00048BA179|nr:DUF4363 family protein [Ruminococcus sp. NK3A76]
MKRVYFCIFILMAVVAVAFFSLVRVRSGGESLSTGIDKAIDQYRLDGAFPDKLVTELTSQWQEYYRSISFAENTEELNDISRLFTELKCAKSLDEFTRSGELIKTSTRIMCENETPYLYSLL